MILDDQTIVEMDIVIIFFRERELLRRLVVFMESRCGVLF
jgi:hypothetical protein